MPCEVKSIKFWLIIHNEPLYFLILFAVLFKKSIPSLLLGSISKCASSHTRITCSFLSRLISFQHQDNILKNWVLNIVSSESTRLWISKTIKSDELSTLILEWPLKILASAPIVDFFNIEEIFSNDSITFRASLFAFACFNVSTTLLYKSCIIG